MLFNFWKKPRVHLYTICWNEEYMLKYFFRYYDPLVDRYIVFDDGSTDQSLSILTKHPKVEIRSFPRPSDNDSYVLAAQNVHNQCWKESRGQVDWVIITAIDEILYTPNLKSYLMACTKNGVTAVPALGYQMISPTVPVGNRNMHDLVRRGCPWTLMNKLSIFNPDKISETNQGLGRHNAEPDGEIKYPATDQLLLLHYKYLSFEHTVKRHADLSEKLGQVDKANGWGQYTWPREKLQNEWNRFEQNSVEDVLAAGYNPHVQHSPLTDRWWRRTQ